MWEEYTWRRERRRNRDQNAIYERRIKTKNIVIKQKITPKK